MDVPLDGLGQAVSREIDPRGEDVRPVRGHEKTDQLLLRRVVEQNGSGLACGGSYPRGVQRLGGEQATLLGGERLVLVPVEIEVDLIPPPLQLCQAARIGSLPAFGSRSGPTR